MIGGNATANLQRGADPQDRDDRGISETGWSDVASLNGWLDMTGGSSDTAKYAAKLQETTHLFLCDWRPIDAQRGALRMVIDERAYEVLLIDDPMGMHEHLEIYLKYTGAMA